MQQMLNLNAVAARLGVCRRTAEELLAEGRLPPPVRFGRIRRWSEDRVNGFIQIEVERAAASAPPAPTPRRGRGRPRGC